MSTLLEMQATHNGKPLDRTLRLDAVPRVGTLVMILGYSKPLKVKQVLYRDGGGITLLLGDDEESWT